MAGVEVGYIAHVVAAVLGVSAILATSATAFTVVKLLGAAWLLRLAWHAFRSRAQGTLGSIGSDINVASVRATTSFRRGLVVGALNPKTAVFYLAFLPQFIEPGAGPAWIQLLVLGFVFIGMSSIPDSLWAVLGSTARSLFPRLRLRTLDRISGAVFTILAAATLSIGRAGAT